jgi:hypothetical protein
MCEVFEDEASTFETQRSTHNTLVASGLLNSAGSSCRDKLGFNGGSYNFLSVHGPHQAERCHDAEETKDQ